MHPDIEELDSVRTGEAPGDARGREVVSHVQGCAACQAVLERLQAFREGLRVEAAAGGQPENEGPAGLARVDAVVRAEIAARLGTREVARGLRAAWGWWLSGAAAAAMLFAVLGHFGRNPAGPAAPGPLAVVAGQGKGPGAAGVRVGGVQKDARTPGDVNGDGKVDVVDAYLLSRMVRGHEEAPAGCDVSGDGKVDVADAHEIARRAVAVERGRS